MAVRPDDVDFYRHVHNTRYLDYYLAARLEQGERCYQMPLAEFFARGLGWFMTGATLRFVRSLGLGDRMVVRTWMESLGEDDCRVGFEIDKLPTGKRVCDGHCDYALVTLANGRKTALPDDVRQKYSV